jgi:tripartite-type tricarboxylate transporter receptor subunit TctC
LDTRKLPRVSQEGFPHVKYHQIDPHRRAFGSGLMAPRGTPKAIVDKLNEAVSKITAQPETKELWAKQGAVPLVMTPEVFDKYVRDDITKWAKVIKTANIKLD